MNYDQQSPCSTLVPHESPPPSPRIPPPEGFSFVEPPDVVYNTQFPLYRNTEINPNEWMYFTYCPLNGRREYIHGHSIRMLSRHKQPWPAHVKLMFMEPIRGGDAILAHIPSHSDMAGLPVIASCVLDYSLDALDNDQSAERNDEADFIVYPPSWANVIDPTPSPRNYGRIFFLRDCPTEVRNYSYSDGLDVFHVLAKISHIKFTFFQTISLPRPDKFMNYLRINPGIAEESQLIPLHTPILVWNCRGVTRPSFLSNLQTLINLHKPVVIVLVESRCPTMDYSDFALRNEDVVDEYEWFNLPSDGFKGGATVLWKANIIKMHNFITASHGYPALMSIAERVSDDDDAVPSHPRARRSLFR